MIRRPPRSTQSRSSAASDVYKRQGHRRAEATPSFGRLCPGMTSEAGTAIMTIRFDGRVAIVTGAGNGLGRAHALALASRGAKVVVNDFGGARDGTGGSLTSAEAVVEEIRNSGGVAMADGADVSNFEQVKAMVARATSEW